MKNKVLIVSALSLAIAGASGVYAGTPSTQAPEDCVVKGGQGESLQEWGMWCGVGSFLAALSDMEPPAAGPADGPELDLNVNPPGRGDAGEYEPEVDSEVDPKEDPKEDLGVPPHIVVPSSGSGDFVGYFAGQDRSASDEMQDEGYGDPVVDNHKTGGFSLSMKAGDVFLLPPEERNGASDENSEVAYNRYERDGSPLDGQRYNSGDENGGARVILNTSPEEQSYLDGRRFEPEQSSDHGIGGSEAVVSQANEGESGSVSDIGSQIEILKNYWIGRLGRNTFADGTRKSTEVVYLAGELTPLAEIQRQIAGDVSATYTGNSHRWEQSVRLDVDFGDQTFNGQFGDLDMYRKMDAGVDTNADMSFTASGVIEGTTLISDEVSADSGFVQGSFFGEQGRIVGGAYDITKGENRVVDVFTAVEGEGNRVSERRYK